MSRAAGNIYLFTEEINRCRQRDTDIDIDIDMVRHSLRLAYLHLLVL